MATRYLTPAEVLRIHARAIATHGGMPGLRDQGGFASAVAQAEATFGGEDLHPTVYDKAAA